MHSAKKQNATITNSGPIRRIRYSPPTITDIYNAIYKTVISTGTDSSTTLNNLTYIEIKNQPNVNPTNDKFFVFVLNNVYVSGFTSFGFTTIKYQVAFADYPVFADTTIDPYTNNSRNQYFTKYLDVKKGETYISDSQHYANYPALLGYIDSTGSTFYYIDPYNSASTGSLNIQPATNDFRSVPYPPTSWVTNNETDFGVRNNNYPLYYDILALNKIQLNPPNDTSDKIIPLLRPYQKICINFDGFDRRNDVGAIPIRPHTTTTTSNSNLTISTQSQSQSNLSALKTITADKLNMSVSIKSDTNISVKTSSKYALNASSIKSSYLTLGNNLATVQGEVVNMAQLATNVTSNINSSIQNLTTTSEMAIISNPNPYVGIVFYKRGEICMVYSVPLLNPIFPTGTGSTGSFQNNNYVRFINWSSLSSTPTTTISTRQLRGDNTTTTIVNAPILISMTILPPVLLNTDFRLNANETNSYVNSKIISQYQDVIGANVAQKLGTSPTDFTSNVNFTSYYTRYTVPDKILITNRVYNINTNTTSTDYPDHTGFFVRVNESTTNYQLWQISDNAYDGVALWPLIIPDILSTVKILDTKWHDPNFNKNLKIPSYINSNTVSFKEHTYLFSQTVNVQNTPYVISTFQNQDGTMRFNSFNVSPGIGVVNFSNTVGTVISFPPYFVEVGKNTLNYNIVTETTSVFTSTQDFRAISYQGNVYLLRTINNVVTYTDTSGNTVNTKLNGLLLDTFVPSGGTLKLKIESRYKRSQLKYFFLPDPTSTDPTSSQDNIDTSDVNGNIFYVPTIYIAFDNNNTRNIMMGNGFYAGIVPFGTQYLWTMVVPVQNLSDNSINIVKRHYYWDSIVTIWTVNDLAQSFGGNFEEIILNNSLYNRGTVIVDNDPSIGNLTTGDVFDNNIQNLTLNNGTDITTFQNFLLYVDGTSYNVEEPNFNYKNGTTSSLTSNINILISVLANVNNTDATNLDPLDPFDRPNYNTMVLLNGWLDNNGYHFTSNQFVDTYTIPNNEISLFSFTSKWLDIPLNSYNIDYDLPDDDWTWNFDSEPQNLDSDGNPTPIDPTTQSNYLSCVRTLVLRTVDDIQSDVACSDTYDSVVLSSINLLNGLNASIFINKKASRRIFSGKYGLSSITLADQQTHLSQNEPYETASQSLNIPIYIASRDYYGILSNGTIIIQTTLQDDFGNLFYVKSTNNTVGFTDSTFLNLGSIINPTSVNLITSIQIIVNNGSIQLEILNLNNNGSGYGPYDLQSIVKDINTNSSTLLILCNSSLQDSVIFYGASWSYSIVFVNVEPLTVESQGIDAFTTYVSDNNAEDHEEAYHCAYVSPMISLSDKTNGLIQSDGDFSVEFWYTVPPNRSLTESPRQYNLFALNIPTTASNSTQNLIQFVSVSIGDLVLSNGFSLELVQLMINDIVFAGAILNDPNELWRHLALVYNQPYMINCHGAGYMLKNGSNYNPLQDLALAVSFGIGALGSKQGLVYKGTGNGSSSNSTDSYFLYINETGSPVFEFLDGMGVQQQITSTLKITPGTNRYLLLFSKKTDYGTGSNPNSNTVYPSPLDPQSIALSAQNTNYNGTVQTGNGGNTTVSGINSNPGSGSNPLQDYTNNLFAPPGNQTYSYTPTFVLYLIVNGVVDSTSAQIDNSQVQSGFTSQANLQIRSSGSGSIMVGTGFEGNTEYPIQQGYVKNTYYFNKSVDYTQVDFNSLSLLKQLGLTYCFLAQYDINGIVTNIMNSNEYIQTRNFNKSSLMPLPQSEVEGTSLYIDGQQIMLLPTKSSAPPTYTFPIFLLNPSFLYEISDFCFWSEARTSSNVADDMYGKSDPSTEPNLQVYFDGVVLASDVPSSETFREYLIYSKITDVADTFVPTDFINFDPNVNFPYVTLNVLSDPIRRGGPLNVPDFYMTPNLSVPITSDSPYKITFSEVNSDPNGNLSGELKELDIFIQNNILFALMGRKVGDLQLNWVSQIQGNAQLIGYIEPAPCPMANLSVASDYRGATSVSLNIATSNNFAYQTSLDQANDNKFSISLGGGSGDGGDSGAPTGANSAGTAGNAPPPSVTPATSSVTPTPGPGAGGQLLAAGLATGAGAISNLNANSPSTGLSVALGIANVLAMAGLDAGLQLVIAPIGAGMNTKSLGLKLTGKGGFSTAWGSGSTFDNKPSMKLDYGDKYTSKMTGNLMLDDINDDLGMRMYIPSPYGQAYVVSETYDVYEERLLQTNTLLGYINLPSPNIPPDINVISFKLNKSYIRPGCLDGILCYKFSRDQNSNVIGMEPVYDLYFKNARSGQDASYKRPLEAYNLKQNILYQASAIPNQYYQSNNSQANAANSSNLIPAVDFYNEYVWNCRGATQELNTSPTTSYQYTYVTQNYNTNAGTTSLEAKLSIFGVTAVDLTLGFDNSTKVTNKYTYDVTSQESFTMSVSADGIESDTQMRVMSATSSGASGSITNRSVNQFVKAVNADPSASALQLYVNPSDNLVYQNVPTQVQNSTSYDIIQLIGGQNPKLAGQVPIEIESYDWPGKTKTFRWYSFFLQSKTDNADSFWNTVVDPVWLADPNNTDAVALASAQAQSSLPWRVMHRVTYSERFLPPAMTEITSLPTLEAYLAIPLTQSIANHSPYGNPYTTASSFASDVLSILTGVISPFGIGMYFYVRNDTNAGVLDYYICSDIAQQFIIYYNSGIAYLDPAHTLKLVPYGSAFISDIKTIATLSTTSLAVCGVMLHDTNGKVFYYVTSPTSNTIPSYPNLFGTVTMGSAFPTFPVQPNGTYYNITVTNNAEYGTTYNTYVTNTISRPITYYNTYAEYIDSSQTQLLQQSLTGSAGTFYGVAVMDTSLQIGYNTNINPTKIQSYPLSGTFTDITDPSIKLPININVADFQQLLIAILENNGNTTTKNSIYFNFILSGSTITSAQIQTQPTSNPGIVIPSLSQLTIYAKQTDEYQDLLQMLPSTLTLQFPTTIYYGIGILDSNGNVKYFTSTTRSSIQNFPTVPLGNVATSIGDLQTRIKNSISLQQNAVFFQIVSIYNTVQTYTYSYGNPINTSTTIYVNNTASITKYLDPTYTQTFDAEATIPQITIYGVAVNESNKIYYQTDLDPKKIPAYPLSGTFKQMSVVSLNQLNDVLKQNLLHSETIGTNLPAYQCSYFYIQYDNGGIPTYYLGPYGPPIRPVPTSTTIHDSMTVIDLYGMIVQGTNGDILFSQLSSGQKIINNGAISVIQSDTNGLAVGSNKMVFNYAKNPLNIAHKYQLIESLGAEIQINKIPLSPLKNFTNFIVRNIPDETTSDNLFETLTKDIGTNTIFYKIEISKTGAISYYITDPSKLPQNQIYVNTFAKNEFLDSAFTQLLYSEIELSETYSGVAYTDVLNKLLYFTTADPSLIQNYPGTTPNLPLTVPFANAQLLTNDISFNQQLFSLIAGLTISNPNAGLMVSANITADIVSSQFSIYLPNIAKNDVVALVDYTFDPNVFYGTSNLDPTQNTTYFAIFNTEFDTIISTATYEVEADVETYKLYCLANLFPFNNLSGPVKYTQKMLLHDNPTAFNSMFASVNTASEFRTELTFNIASGILTTLSQMQTALI